MDTSTKLIAAIAMYRQYGFVEKKEFVSKYVTCDMFLELPLEFNYNDVDII
jgi:hypothetical protein